MDNRKESAAAGRFADVFSDFFKELVETTVSEALNELDNEIYHFRGMVREDFNEQTKWVCFIMREVADCKALLKEIRDLQVSDRRRAVTQEGDE